MPELPEVEIAREQLERWLLGRRLRGAHAPDARLRGGQSRRKLEVALSGATVIAVTRRGKFLILELGAERPSILAHLGMTGKFVHVPRGETLPRFSRVVLELSRGERVVFADARRFGEFRLLDAKEKRRLARLGVEPLSREFGSPWLLRMTRGQARTIKLFLMDQKRIAGLGNIQVAEALFLAGIHPKRAAGSLTADEVVHLARSLRRSLRREIARYRSEELRYLHEGGENHFLAYGRAGKPCVRCRTPIVRFVQNARSSYYCPSCQPERILDEAKKTEPVYSSHP